MPLRCSEPLCSLCLKFRKMSVTLWEFSARGSARARKTFDAHVFDERFCSMTCTCASSEWCLPVEREQPYDVHPYTECDTDTTSNLRQLRLKLDSLRDRQHERAAGASPRKRSSMEQLAVRRKAHPRTLPQQPVCNMENLLPVRLEGGVHSEGGLQGDVPTSGAEKHRFWRRPPGRFEWRWKPRR